MGLTVGLAHANSPHLASYPIIIPDGLVLIFNLFGGVRDKGTIMVSSLDSLGLCTECCMFLHLPVNFSFACRWLLTLRFLPRQSEKLRFEGLL